MSSPYPLSSAVNPFASSVPLPAVYQLVDVAAPTKAAPKKTNRDTQKHQDLCKRVSLAVAFIIGGIVGTQYIRANTETILNMVFAGCISTLSPFPLNRSIRYQTVGLSLLWGSVAGGTALYESHSAVALTLMVLGEFAGTGFATWPLLLMSQCNGQGKQAVSHVNIGMSESTSGLPKRSLDSQIVGIVVDGKAYEPMD